MVGSETVVEDEPFGGFVVESVDVAEQEVFVVIDELFLNGAVEAFVFGVHFGASGVGV